MLLIFLTAYQKDFLYNSDEHEDGLYIDHKIASV